ncbi:hypothetical protein DOM22_06355 [Bdellovibrio sp. ZAP7]|nr:hypothetical protein DOM22_06355 [Bdellovibrio sp. ZAP7]
MTASVFESPPEEHEIRKLVIEAKTRLVIKLFISKFLYAIQDFLWRYVLFLPLLDIFQRKFCVPTRNVDQGPRRLG